MEDDLMDSRRNRIVIDWSFPPPRLGLAGILDKFLGPGTTRAELWLQGVVSVAAGVAMLTYADIEGLSWTPLQYVVATFLAFDLAGGIVTNACSSAKRWYHREGRGFWAHFSFVALHVVYVLLVAWLFRSMDWVFFAVVSSYLLGGSAIVLKVPLYLQRPVAFSFLVGAFLLSLYAFSPTLGLEWFVPLLFFKLGVSHSVREEPYRPASETRRKQAGPGPD